MDSDEQPIPDPDAVQTASPEGTEGNHGEPSDAAPEDDEASGAAPSSDAAADAYGDPEQHVGDFTDPDVDLSNLIARSDGDPDDEQDPAPEDVPAGEPGEHSAVAWDETDPGLPVSQP